MICLSEITPMLYYQNVVLLNAFKASDRFIFQRKRNLFLYIVFVAQQGVQWAGREHFSASCSVKIGFKNKIGKKELPEAERKKKYCCVAKTRPIWLQKLFRIGEGPSDLMPIYPRSE